MKKFALKKTIFKLALLSLAMLAAGFRASLSAQESSDQEKRVSESIQVFQEIAGLTDTGIPRSLLGKAYGVVIIPGVVKAAYGLGGEYGRGVLLVQDKGIWSNPSFITLAGGSVGWQIGVQKSDLLLVFRTKKSIDDIAEGKITLGADASVAAGPVGRGAQATTDIELQAEIYAYSKSKGLFIGISIKGAAIQIDGDANRKFYNDQGITARRIFTDPALESRPIAGKLRQVLTEYLTPGTKI